MYVDPDLDLDGCMYVCLQTRMYVCKHICMYAYMHICMYACMHVCVCVCVCVSAQAQSQAGDHEFMRLGGTAQSNALSGNEVSL